MGGKGLEAPPESPLKIAILEAPGAESGALPAAPLFDDDAAGLAAVVRAWPAMCLEARTAIREISAYAERWAEYSEWARRTVAHLVFVALQHRWSFKGRARASSCGSWYLTFRREGRRISVRIANHKRRLQGMVQVLWPTPDATLAELVRKLERPDDETASASA